MAAVALPTPPARAQPGLLRRILRDPHPVLDELRDAYCRVGGFGAGPVRLAVVGDPAALPGAVRHAHVVRTARAEGHGPRCGCGAAPPH